MPELHGELGADDMIVHMILESIYCTCDEHPDNFDPDCRFCTSNEGFRE